ncbi:MAG: CatA-like O-acetyltransferase [Lachnospiraceae bacterium]|nr:CatA-like O-acetyltransferase [Lachnospiraceae bacterium]
MRMEFEPIDMETWERREHFAYYTNTLRTSYHMNVDIEITDFYEWTRKNGYRFFPSFLYVIMTGVNQNKEFRMAYKDGVLGFYKICHPSYTIFHKDDCTFSDIWSEYDFNFERFYANCIRDMETYKDVKGVKTKPDLPPNFCPVSCAPWVTVTGFGHDTSGPSKMYFPVINFSRFYTKEEHGEEKLYLPLSIFINHAAADGYHTSKLILDIQKIAASMGKGQFC